MRIVLGITRPVRPATGLLDDEIGQGRYQPAGAQGRTRTAVPAGPYPQGYRLAVR
jgi:hypothetical protein